MEESLIFDNKKFISSKRAAEITGYTKDYVGQLCRGGKIEARLIGRNWYVSEESILEHKNAKKVVHSQPEILVSDLDQDIALAEERYRALLSKEAERLPAVVEENNVIERQELVPVDLSAFATTRPPTRLELERKMRQDALLTRMQVGFMQGEPLFYSDDAPLNPSPSRPEGYQRFTEDKAPRIHHAPLEKPSPKAFSISSTSSGAKPTDQSIAGIRPITRQKRSVRSNFVRPVPAVPQKRSNEMALASPPSMALVSFGIACVLIGVLAFFAPSQITVVKGLTQGGQAAVERAVQSLSEMF